MSWAYFSRADSHTEDGRINTTGVDSVCLGCDTEREAKFSIRRFKALGYELYDDKTGTEYAGDLKTAYGALNRFAVRNNFSDVAGYRLYFRREFDKYNDAEGMIECEEKLLRASEADVADFSFMRNFLGLTFAVCVGVLIVVIIVALIAYAVLDVASDGAFSLIIDILFWISIAGVGSVLVIGIVYGIASKCGFAWHYRLSKLRRLVKKDRREIEKRSEAGESVGEDAANIGLGIEDYQGFMVLSADDDNGDSDRNK